MERKIRCVAIDDEVLALDVIEKFCSRLGGIELRVFTDPAEGLEVIRETRPDVVFLDIEMEDITGLAIARMLPEGTCFIFTTAYLDYALEGFNLDAVDYLHKPFAYSRFLTAMEKATRRLAMPVNSAAPRNLVVKQDYTNVSIPFGDILYIEAMEGYSKIFRTQGDCVISRVILKQVCAMLPPGEFVRIHRSFVVPVSKIKSFPRQEVRLAGGKALPVGRQYVAAVKDLFKA